MFGKKKRHTIPAKREFDTLTFSELDTIINDRIGRITQELRTGFDFLKTIEKSVTFFGSARTAPDDYYYKKAKALGNRITEELGFTVITGGGPGIMRAANCGSTAGGGKSIGFTIKLPTEQTTNTCVTGEVPFNYFFSRKVCMTYSAEAYVYFPGGYGTLDELFEILTLVQTNKIEKVPIILVGNKYFGELEKFLKKNILKYGMIDQADMQLYTITEDEEIILDIIRNAPIRKLN